MTRRYTARRSYVQPCQYCGKEVRNLGLHLTGCVAYPPVREATRQALDDGTGTIRSTAEYIADCRGGVAYKTLRETFHGWPVVAEHFGLRLHARYSPRGRTMKFVQITALDRTIAKMAAELDAEIARNRALRFDCKGSCRM